MFHLLKIKAYKNCLTDESLIFLYDYLSNAVHYSSQYELLLSKSANPASPAKSRVDVSSRRPSSSSDNASIIFPQYRLEELHLSHNQFSQAATNQFLHRIALMRTPVRHLSQEPEGSTVTHCSCALVAHGSCVVSALCALRSQSPALRAGL